MSNKLGLEFPILTDKDNILAVKFGLVFTLPEEMCEIYKSFGIDLERYNANNSWALPMPARYIIGQDGLILEADINVDHTTRPEPDSILATLESLSN